MNEALHAVWFSRDADRAQFRKTSAPWIYAELLQASRSKHERYAELKEWIPDDFDPESVDVDHLTDQLEGLAKRWSRKPAARRQRPA